MVLGIKKRIKTPCIGVCSTGIGDSVCRGCKRYAHEVIDWNGYTDAQRTLIYARLNGFISQVVKRRISIQDAGKLRAFVEAQRIPVSEGGDDYVRIYAVLKAGAQQLGTLAKIGCEILPEHQGLSLPELREAIDQDFYTLSAAHYERYFLHHA